MITDDRMALISFDGVNLLLPQNAVSTIEATESVRIEQQASGAIGRLEAEAGDWPVFALDGNFEPQTDCPPSYQFCVAINNPGESAFGIACEIVETVEVDDHARLQPLQDCMSKRGSPISSLLFRDRRLMLVSDGESMYEYLNRSEAA